MIGFSKRMANDNNMIFLHNNQVNLHTYKYHEKKRFSSKNMKISHKKQILYLLPTLNDNDKARGRS